MTLGKQIKTEQLILRPFALSDAKDAQRLVSGKEIARMPWLRDMLKADCEKIRK